MDEDFNLNSLDAEITALFILKKAEGKIPYGINSQTILSIPVDSGVLNLQKKREK
ncbi:MAG: hypothetical protein F6K24_45215 [Okeania sp. SIO2D1]|nr:hypothetical protein [Okeania sp. SIO2D1]